MGYPLDFGFVGSSAVLQEAHAVKIFLLWKKPFRNQ
jgi:hypothetical protein